MTRPTRAAFAWLAAAGVLRLLSQLTGDGWLSLASGGALALPVVALALRPRPDDLEVTVDPVRCASGATVLMGVRVRNAGTRRSPPVRLTDASPLMDPVTVAVPALAPGEVASVLVSRTARRRGLTEGVQLDARTSAPLGIVTVRRTVEAPGRRVVHPVSVPASRVAAGAVRPGHGISLPLAGQGTEVLGLRPWRPGDAGRAVHARSSARHAQPVVLEREREAGRTLVLLVTEPGQGEAWEAAVARCAAMAVAAVHDGAAPVLLATGLASPPAGAESVKDWFAALDAARRADAAVRATAHRLAGPAGGMVVLAPEGERWVTRDA